VPVDNAEASIPVVVAVVISVPVLSGSVRVLSVFVAGGTIDIVPVPLVVNTSILLKLIVPFDILYSLVFFVTTSVYNCVDL
jgi:hypothetical protein